MSRKPTYKELEQRIKDLEEKRNKGKLDTESMKKEIQLQMALLDNIPGCIALILKKDTREIVASNRSARELGAIPGKTCFNTCASRDDSCPFCLAPKLWETGQPQLLEVKEKGIWYEGIWVPFSDDLYIHYFFDINDRKNAEDALRENEKKYRDLFDNSADIIYTMDLDGNFKDVNKATEDITGYTKNELIGNNFKDYTPETLHARIFNAFNKVFTESKPIKNFSLEVIVKGGDKKYLETCVSPLRKGAQIIGFQGSSRDITERKQAEERLRESEERFRTVLGNLPGGVIAHDIDGKILYVNDVASQNTGYPKETLLNMSVADIDPGSNIRDDETRLWQNLNLGESIKIEATHIRKDGSEYPAEVYLNLIMLNGKPVILVIAFDITKRKRSEDEINQRMRQATLVAEIGTILVQNIDLHKLLQLCTESIVKHLDAAFARIWILNEQKNILELKASAGMYTHLDGEHSMISMGQYKIGLIAQEKKPHLTNDIINDPRIKDLEWAKKEGMVAFAGHPLIVADKLVGVIAIFSKKPLQDAALKALASISDGIALGITRKKAEDQIHFLAYYDSMTGLPNRYLFREIVKKIIESAGRNKQAFALVLIDLDNFSRINDTLGHILGDEFLNIFSSRLLTILRTSDYIARMSDKDEPMARMGGDEFIVLLEQVGDVEKARRVSQRILHEMSRSYELDGREVFVTSSIGIVIYPNDGKNVEDLLKNVDTALYHAKRKGKNNFQFYSESMNEAAIEIMTMEANLRRALEKREFIVYYQPKVNLLTRKIAGMEALVRWKTPEGNLISPARFIPIAEANGLIVPIDIFVLQTASLQNQKWQEAGLTKVSVAVNVSGLQFGQKDFVQDVFTILKNTGLDPDYLELEVTETTVMSDPERAIRNLKKLKEAGIKISLDDFGTGYSSLNYLQRLPIDTMKIDISFIRDVLSNPNDAVIVKTIIAMAHNMNLKVIAEGVEDEHQLNFLEEHQCDIIQGYFFSPPVPAEKFEELLKTGG